MCEIERTIAIHALFVLLHRILRSLHAVKHSPTECVLFLCFEG